MSLPGRAVNVDPPKTSSGRPLLVLPVGKICVELPTTTKAAEESRLMRIPAAVAVPPGVKVCPGPMKNWVAALGTRVTEPIVRTGGGR